MTSHTYHPDSHEFGLVDGCPRCDQHATDPLTGLDDENLLALYARVNNKLESRSGNEAGAMRIVASAARLHRLLAERGA